MVILIKLIKIICNNYFIISDPDFRGNIGVILFNHSRRPFKVKKGDRIAQLIYERYLQDAHLFEDRSIFNQRTTRNENSFGSTGGFGKTEIAHAIKGFDTCDRIVQLGPNGLRIRILKQNVESDGKSNDAKLRCSHLDSNPHLNSNRVLLPIGSTGLCMPLKGKLSDLVKKAEVDKSTDKKTTDFSLH